MNFSAAVQEQLAGRLVRVDALVEFSFKSTVVRMWNGFGQLATSDGKTWEGLAGIGNIDGLEQAINGVAPTQSFTVSGVDARFAATAKGERSEWYRQPVTVFLQFFDENWQTLDAPFAISLRQMDSITATRARTDDGEFTYTVSINAETPFTTRSRPPYGYLTDRDQQLRYPGDRGLERVAGIDGKTVAFPDY